MEYLTYKSPYGDYKVYINLSTYAYDNSISIELMCENGEPFGHITTVIPDGWRDKPSNWAYVDVNNMPDAIDFIKKYNLGEIVKNVKDEEVKIRSGFVYYPLYKFNINELLKYTWRDKRVVL